MLEAENTLLTTKSGKVLRGRDGKKITVGSFADATPETVAGLVQNFLVGDVGERIRDNKYKIFSGLHKDKILKSLHEAWVEEAGIFAEEKQRRMQILHECYVPSESNNLSQGEKDLLFDAATPLYFISSILEKPINMRPGDYADRIVNVCNEAGASRKTEVLLVGLEKLMLREMSYANYPTVERETAWEEFQPQQELPEASIRAVNGAIDRTSGVETIMGFITEGEAVQKRSIASKWFGILHQAKLIGTGYEKSVVEYAKEPHSKKAEYALHVARLEMKKQIQNAADALRKPLIGQAEGTDLRKIDLTTTFTKGEGASAQPIQLRVFLERAAESGRLQRECTKYVMKKLKNNANNLKDAALLTAGKDSLQNMAQVIASMNAEDMYLINQMMQGVMDEIDSQHNLVPSWTGKFARNLDSLLSYPTAILFAVFDFFAECCEHIVSLFSKKEVFNAKDVEKAIKALRTVARNMQEAAEGSPAKQVPTNEEARNAEIAKLDNPAEAKAAYEKLQKPEMNQGLSTSFAKTARVSQAAKILSL